MNIKRVACTDAGVGRACPREFERSNRVFLVSGKRESWSPKLYLRRYSNNTADNFYTTTHNSVVEMLMPAVPEPLRGIRIEFNETVVIKQIRGYTSQHAKFGIGMKDHAPKTDRSWRPKALTHRTLASLAVGVLLLSPSVLLEITDAASDQPPTRAGARPAKTHTRPGSSAQLGDAATLPAGLALDACGAPFIADIEKFLETCPGSDPATNEILNDFQIRRNGVLVGEILCLEPVSQIPLSEYTDALIVLQGLRVMYYMDRAQHGHLPWTLGSMYDWMKSRIQGIDIRDIAGGFCCEQFDGKLHFAVGAQDDLNRELDRNWEWISGNIGLYGHETRHVDGFGHTSCCGRPFGCDQTYDEDNLTPYAILWWLSKSWLMGDINVGFSCMNASRIQEIVNWYSVPLFHSGDVFCDNKPPLVALPAFPGGQCPATAADFALGFTPDMLILEPGASASFTVEVHLDENARSSDAVRLCSSVTPGDGGVSLTISPESLKAGGSAILTVTTTPESSPGTYVIGIGGTSGLHVHTQSATVVISGPLITGAEMMGKHLYVYGEKFDDGAKVLLDGVKHKKTSNDELNPATVLIARKAGKKIAPGQTVTIQVRNPDGVLSNELTYRRPVE